MRSRVLLVLSARHDAPERRTMNPKTKTLVLFAIGTGFAWLAYAQTDPQPGQWIFTALEGATFGAGLAFLASAWPAMRASTGSYRSARLAYVATGYLLLTWSLADTLTFHTGVALLDVLLDEHAYHVTVLAAGAAIAQYVARLVRERAADVEATRVA